MISQATIVCNLIRARQAFGLSQTELAQRCKFTQHEIDNIEHSRSAISPEVLIEVARVLNCSPCDLLLFICRKQVSNNQRTLADQRQFLVAINEYFGCIDIYLLACRTLFLVSASCVCRQNLSNR
jgi:transcriptional regulator with XRE-family HTH domain